MQNCNMLQQNDRWVKPNGCVSSWHPTDVSLVVGQDWFPLPVPARKLCKHL